MVCVCTESCRCLTNRRWANSQITREICIQLCENIYPHSLKSPTTQKNIPKCKRFTLFFKMHIFLALRCLITNRLPQMMSTEIHVLLARLHPLISKCVMIHSDQKCQICDTRLLSHALYMLPCLIMPFTGDVSSSKSIKCCLAAKKYVCWQH